MFYNKWWFCVNNFDIACLSTKNFVGPDERKLFRVSKQCKWLGNGIYGAMNVILARWRLLQGAYCGQQVFSMFDSLHIRGELKKVLWKMVSEVQLVCIIFRNNGIVNWNSVPERLFRFSVVILLFWAIFHYQPSYITKKIILDRRGSCSINSTQPLNQAGLSTIKHILTHTFFWVPHINSFRTD